MPKSKHIPAVIAINVDPRITITFSAGSPAADVATAIQPLMKWLDAQIKSAYDARQPKIIGTRMHLRAAKKRLAGTMQSLRLSEW